jgi:hypothetical protein
MRYSVRREYSVDVATFQLVHDAEGEVVDGEQVDRHQLLHLVAMRVVEACVCQHLEHLVGGDRENGVSSKSGGVAEGVSQGSR